MRALLEGVEEADDGVAAQPEDHLDAETLEVVGQQIRGDPRIGGGCDALDRRLARYVHVVSFHQAVTVDFAGW